MARLLQGSLYVCAPRHTYVRIINMLMVLFILTFPFDAHEGIIQVGLPLGGAARAHE